MSTNGWRSSSRDSAALHVENIDRMPHDVAVTVTDGAGERVFDTEFAVWHGDDAVHANVFTTEGPYDVTVSVRYGPTELLRHDGGTLYLAITDGSGSGEVDDAASHGVSEEAGQSAVERNV